MNQDNLRVAAEAALELEKRKKESKLLFYKPCCRVHKNNCPSRPCLESKHTKFHLSDKRIRIALGGNRSGKTSLGITELLMMSCLKVHPYRKTPNPSNGKYRIYGSDFGVIEKIHIPMVKQWIPRESLAEGGKTKEDAWHNSFDPKYHILNLKDATLDFMSYDQETSKSASVELDGVAADEEIPEDVFSEALARVVSRNGLFWMTVTPLYKMSWALNFLDGVDPSVEVFNFDIYDNPYISEQAIKDFEASIPEHEKEARIHGRFLELQGMVYKELRTDIHLIASDRNEHSYPVVFTLDPHPRKPSSMTWSYVTPKGDVVFFDELEQGGTARDIARAIRLKEREHKGRTMLRLIDPAAKGQGSNITYETDTLREFEKEGLDFSLADNSEAGYNVVHEYLTFNPELPISSFNRPKCFFTRDCSKTWYSMTHLLWDDWARRSLRDKKEVIKDYNKDFADCVRYTLAIRPNQRMFSPMQAVRLGGTPQNMEVSTLVIGRI